MLLNVIKEETGNRIALSPDIDPDLPSGLWKYFDTVNVPLGNAPYRGFRADEILESIDREGVFIGVPRDA